MPAKPAGSLLESRVSQRRLEAEVAASGQPRIGFIALLAALTAAGPVAMQIFLPALPLIQEGLATTPAMAQLTLSLSMLAIAVATLVYGPLADRYGRRPVMLAGLVLVSAGSVLCALAVNIGMLIAARLLQAAGGAAGMVLTRAIARDRFGAAGAARVISQLTMIMVVAPMIAPAVGGGLTDAFGWRSTFWFVAALGLVLFALAARGLAESRPPGTVSSTPLAMLSSLPTLFGSRLFSAYVVQTAFTSMIFFSFISGAPYVMAHMLHRPASEYGLYYILVSGGFMIGNMLSLRIGHWFTPGVLLVAGSCIALAGSVLLAGIVAVSALTPAWLFLPMMFGSVGNGLVMPNAQAAAINVFPERAGAASGISGFLQMIFAATASQLVGVLQNGTAWPMLALMLLGGGGALLATLVAVRSQPPGVPRSTVSAASG